MNRMYNIPRALVMTLACYGVLEIVGVIIIIIIIITNMSIVVHSVRCASKTYTQPQTDGNWTFSHQLNTG